MARLLIRPDTKQSANTASKISTASKFSAHEEFLTKYQFRNIDELIDLSKGEVLVIVATVILIQEEEGWWYLGCRKCNKKVVRGDDVLDLEDKDTSATNKGTKGFFCKTCDETCSSVVTRSKLEYKFQDQKNSEDIFIFGSALEDFICVVFVPNRNIDQTSDVAVKDTNVSQLVLESVTDDNGTPFDLLKSITSTPNNNSLTNKHNRDGVLGDEGSNTKRQKLDKMGEKN
ncbi:nucleic acid-binding, OB-fold protein [Tanacetum coccineum]